MTADIVNLRQKRKQKARDEKRAEADANAREHGRSRAERALTGAVIRLDRARHDGQKLDPGPDDPN